MQTVLIVFHLLIVIALVAVVLLQRSEGGALGVGGGGGFMTGRGQANVLTRATAILAALFFATSLTLTLLARYAHNDTLNFNNIGTNKNETVLDKLKQFENRKREPALSDEVKTNAPGATATAPVTAASEGGSKTPAGQTPAGTAPTNFVAPATQTTPSTSMPATPAGSSSATPRAASPAPAGTTNGK